MKRMIVSVVLLTIAGTAMAGSPPRCDAAPKLLTASRPRYTPEGRRAAVEGDVVLDVLFKKDGHPRSAVVVKGLPFGLDDAAAESVITWKFKAPRVHGRRAQCVSSIRVPFRLAENPK